MDSIENNRKKLDELDDVIIAKLIERFEVSKEIGRIKKQQNIEVFQPDREKAIFESIKSRCKGYEDVDAVIKIYNAIMNESKALQIY
ncbi:MAG: chorismate mutase [Clostridia bacterium]|nr:chorismate mutase [Clostridia bacterium]